MSENNTEQQHITVSPNITVASSADRWFRIIGTLAVSGGVVAIAYALANYGLLEVAATATTTFFFQWLRLMFSTGIIKNPVEKRLTASEVTNPNGRYFMQLLVAGYAAGQEKLAQSKSLTLALAALAYTALFMICRWLMGISLGLVSNLWIAVGFGAIIGGVFIAPEIVTSMVKKIKGDKRGNENASA